MCMRDYSIINIYTKYYYCLDHELILNYINKYIMISFKCYKKYPKIKSIFL